VAKPRQAGRAVGSERARVRKVHAYRADCGCWRCAKRQRREAAREQAASVADLESTNLGTIITITALTDRGRRWLHQHVQGGRVVGGSTSPLDCDHRYGIDILHAALAAGLRLRDTGTGQLAYGVDDAD